MESRIKKLESLGQSIWIDYIRRDFVVSELNHLIEEDGLQGMTSNPAIFEKAFLDSTVYDPSIQTLLAAQKSAAAIYEALSQEDVRSAAERFRPVYGRTEGKDGYVSLEVNPHLAHDTVGTISEARRLWATLDLPNVLIKVPASAEGLPAIRQLISEGISINVTLIFGIDSYRKVADAYMQGLRDRIAQNKPVHNVVSVASFFLSRIDVMLDPVLEEIVRQGGEHAELAAKAFGQVAIASAKTAYQRYQEMFEGDSFAELRSHGANVQRLLWASTGAKNPKFSDLKYVEPLIGRNTVSTLPLETFYAYRERGNPDYTMEAGAAQAQEVLDSLSKLGIDMDAVVRRLEVEGIQKFIDAYDKLLLAINQRIGRSES